MGYGIVGSLSSMAVIESILRILTYIAVISVCFKGVQALNTYISNNSRRY